MIQDIVDLRSFYTSRLGQTVQRFVRALIKARWQNFTGQSILGLGYAVPYLDLFRENALRTLAFMPAQMGVMHWPDAGVSATALVDPLALPLPDSCIDRLLLIHGLEGANDPSEMLNEIWRVLTPNGRLLVIVPNRRGLWARFDTTPFGTGRPFSRGQLRDLLRNALFSPLLNSEALYMPPSSRLITLSLATAFEHVGAGLGLPGAGILVTEAVKQGYRPVGQLKSFKQLPNLQPVFVPVVRRDCAISREQR